MGTYLSRYRVDVYEVFLYCDCGGDMRPTDRVLLSHPPLYPHKCTLCGTVTNEKRTYPAVDYETTR